jgi:hypothetical protein
MAHSVAVERPVVDAAHLLNQFLLHVVYRSPESSESAVANDGKDDNVAAIYVFHVHPFVESRSRCSRRLCAALK